MPFLGEDLASNIGMPGMPILLGLLGFNPYFGASTLQKKAFSNQNSGHLGSRYIYIYI